MDKEQLKILINGKLIRHFGKEFSNATEVRFTMLPLW